MNKAGFIKDIRGGINGALLSLPAAIALGPLFFAYLGPGYISLGVYSAVIAIGMGNIGSSFIKSSPYIITGPSLVGTMLLASAASRVSQHSPHLLQAEILAILFLIIFISGIIQVLFGILKLGFLIKYIPYPILAGLVNGTAVKIILGQGRRILASSPSGTLEIPAAALALTTIAAIGISARFVKKIPSQVTGIAVGYTVYFLMRRSGLGEIATISLGNVPAWPPLPEYAAGFIRLLFDEKLTGLIAVILPIAFSIALLNSLRSLMTLVSLDGVSLERSDCEKELLSQGAGNMLSSIFGGASSSGAAGPSVANYFSGAGSLSKVYAGIIALFSIFLLNPVLNNLPSVVLTSVVFATGFLAFDRLSVSQAFRLFRNRGGRELYADTGIMLAVALTLIFKGIFEAVGFGLVIALAAFSIKMGRDIVRRKVTAREIRSSVHRPKEELDCLDRHGDEILFIELDGALFFGTTDRLAAKIYDLDLSGVSYIILDFRRISEIDSTGAHILLQIERKCRREGVTLILSSIPEGSCFSGILQACGVTETIGRSRIFARADYALSWSEDSVIYEKTGETPGAGSELLLSGIDVLKRFSPSELAAIEKYFEKKEFPDGSRVFAQGDAADGIYFITLGRARIYVRENEGRLQRIGTLSKGASFGEMSSIDGKPRSATVMAEKGMKCLYISKSSLEKLEKRKPRIAYAFLAGISRDMAGRFRVANRITVDLG